MDADPPPHGVKVARRNTDKGSGEADWSLTFAIGVLVAATVAIAFESEMLSGTITQAAGSLHLSPMFLGVIVLALVGTAGDLFAAAWFAHEDRMGLVLNTCIGSAIQVALVLASLLVIFSWALGHPMTLVFSNPLHLFGIASVAFIVNAIARDGETTWFEGLLLLGVYVLFGLAFFFASPACPLPNLVMGPVHSSSQLAQSRVPSEAASDMA